MDKSLYSRNQTAFLDLLREVRRKANLRQVDVARELGEPQSFVSKYESGERRLDVLELRQICRVLQTTLPAFVKQLENRLPN